jgi:hypothetical protein
MRVHFFTTCCANFRRQTDKQSLLLGTPFCGSQFVLAACCKFEAAYVAPDKQSARQGNLRQHPHQK